MKTNKPQIFQFDLQGKRQDKYDFLNENSLHSIAWNTLNPQAPNFFFANKNFDGANEYENGFKVDELFMVKSSGVKTHDDDNLVASTFNELKIKLESKYISFDILKFQKYAYRPFENGFVYYDTKILGRARERTIYHLLKENIGLKLVSQPQAANLNYFDCVFIANRLTDTNMFRRGGPVVFPLYLYPEENSQDLFAKQERTPNLKKEIVDKIAESLGLKFVSEKSEISDVAAGTGRREGTGRDLSVLRVGDKNGNSPIHDGDKNGNSSIHDGNKINGDLPSTFSPIDILDYIYAVLHSPSYREKYKEFLKIDFPRVPYPTDLAVFRNLVSLGSQLRQIHLLESPVVEKYITQYPIDGTNQVEKPKYENGKVWINETQYFANVPETAWNFYIGGYQPAQKWLKDRKDRTLDFEDILHYQKIIVALTETDRIMKVIDEINFE